jgi:phytoene dehydrogenase-like protein
MAPQLSLGVVTDAVVVGSGPNGLTAAVVLARAGLTVTVLEQASLPGGGCRSERWHAAVVDHCATVHPLAHASPAFAALGLDIAYGRAPIDLAHPLPDGAATLADVPDLGTAPLAAFFGPPTAMARHPVAAVRYGPRFAAPATLTARMLGERGGAVFAGIAAHAITRLDRPLTSAVAYLLAGARPWSVPIGGSGAIVDALLAALEEAGGTVVCDTEVTSLPPADLVLLDTGFDRARTLLGDAAPGWIRRRRWRSGGAVCKLDLLVDGGIGWTDPVCRAAAVVHLGGSAARIAAIEREVAAGRLPERPFAVLSQQYLADPSRVAGTAVPISLYGHVPTGYDGDRAHLAAWLLTEVDRHAPGVREAILAQRVTAPADFARANPNLTGGDIAAGATTPGQLLRRPRLLDPYRLTDRVFLCSAAASPGPGVHGVPGWNAAHRALRSTARC